MTDDTSCRNCSRRAASLTRRDLVSRATMSAVAIALVAFSLVCTHQGATTNIDADDSITRPLHGARYTSAWVWTGGQRTLGLVRLPVAHDAAGANASITLG